MHLGNGWFLTANHVSANSSISISQNGQTAKISYVDNTLNSSYGADLKLFYVEDYQSLTSLSSVSIGSQNAYASLETTTFGYSSTGNIITGYAYDLTYERGTLITIAGAFRNGFPCGFVGYSGHCSCKKKKIIFYFSSRFWTPIFSK